MKQIELVDECQALGGGSSSAAAAPAPVAVEECFNRYGNYDFTVKSFKERCITGGGGSGQSKPKPGEMLFTVAHLGNGKKFVSAVGRHSLTPGLKVLEGA